MSYTQKTERPESVPLLDAKIVNLKRFAEEGTKNWSLFNPSIAQSPVDGSYVCAFRASNYVIMPDTGELRPTEGAKIKNRIYFSDITSDYKVANLRQINVSSDLVNTSRGMEDPKLFWRDGNWCLTAVMMEEHTPVARTAVCKLNKEATEITEIFVEAGVDASKPEKNWMLPDRENSKNFDYVYGPSAIVSGGSITFLRRDFPILSGLRGNSHLLELPDGTYLGVMHRLWTKKTYSYAPHVFGMQPGLDKNYIHFFARFDRFGRLFQLSDPFQFMGRGIEFAAGLADHGDSYVISFGKQDVSSHLAIIRKDTVGEMLKDVETVK